MEVHLRCSLWKWIGRKVLGATGKRSGMTVGSEKHEEKRVCVLLGRE